MRPQNTTIVVSRYGTNDVTWTRRLVEHGFRVLIYERPPNSGPYFVPKNKGNEAASYLKHIIDFYDSLSKHTIFIHDHEHAWHHGGSLVDIIQSCSAHHYRSLNNICLGNMRPNVNKVYKKMVSFFDTFLAPYLGVNTEDIGDWTPGNVCCAQFIVSRERVLQHPKKMYEAIYNHLMRIDGKVGGHLLEWTWPIIFEDKRKLRKIYDPTHPKRRLTIEMGDRARCLQ